MQAETKTMMWWRGLSAIAALNIGVWLYTFNAVAAASDYARWQAWLSGIYVLVCAYRSWLPRIDLERYCMVDSWLSSVFLGRSAATVAEVSFAAQVALWLHTVGQLHDLPLLRTYAFAVVPALTLAQVFCWGGVTTLNHGFHAIEESLWTATMLGVGICLVTALPHASGATRVYVIGGMLGCFSFVAFMSLIDVPMYIRRWRRGRDDGARYLSVRQGIHDTIQRREVTRAWTIWKPEVAWLTGYFSFAVWISLALAHFPLE